MSGKREHEENEEEGNLLESKRQKVSEEVLPDSSPPASLLPGFNYGDEDDEERRAAVNGKGDGKLVLAGHNGVEEGEEEDEEQGLYQHRSREIEVRRDCPYLDAVNRQVLDFDFEKFCSLSLSNLNVYACLVCGKYYQGRGRKSHAYTHSLEAGHHVFINLRTEKVYCLPDGYEISDPSLDDIRHVLNPREVCANLHLRSISLNSDAYWSCLRRNRLSRLTETSSGRGHLMVLITFLE